MTIEQAGRIGYAPELNTTMLYTTWHTTVFSLKTLLTNGNQPTQKPTLSTAKLAKETKDQGAPATLISLNMKTGLKAGKAQQLGRLHSIMRRTGRDIPTTGSTAGAT